MNSFIKQVLATVVGIMLFFLITGVIATMSLVGMIASSEATKNVKENSVLVINLSGVMKERSQQADKKCHRQSWSGEHLSRH